MLGLSQGLAVAVAYVAAVERDIASGKILKRDICSRDEAAGPSLGSAVVEKLDGPE